MALEEAFELPGDMEPEGGEGAPADMQEDRTEVERWLMEAPAQVNLIDVLDLSDVSALGVTALKEYEIDDKSRADWFGWMERAQKLASMVKGEKNWPFKGAANIKYPLIATGALRFNADAYPAIVPPGDIVKAKVNGGDSTGAKRARGERVAQMTSFQLRSEIENWERDTDSLLMQIAIAGTMHRKVWFDPTLGKRCIKLLPPGALVVNDGAPSLAMAPRVSEKIELYPDEVEGRIRRGIFRKGDWKEDGEEEDSLAPLCFIEQHRRHDLDGDGYPEPYVVTVHESSQTVVRVVANWRPEDVTMDAGTGDVIEIKARNYYVDYHFMPSLTGGYHSIGLGVLLGDLSETIDSILNMLADAGKMQTLGSGWIGREGRLGGGRKPFEPGEYRNVSVTGQELRSAIVQRDVQPSAVMFQLLGLMIDAARELANVQNIQEQSQRSNQPATTTIALIEQGKAVYSAVFKRIFLSLKREFTALAAINAETLDPEEYSRFCDKLDEQGQPAMLDPRQDFDLSDMDIEPVADPRAMTSPQKMAQAQLLMELSGTGRVDPGEATNRMLEAAGVPDVEALAPKQDPAQAQVQSIVMGEQIKGVQLDNLKKQADAMRAFADAEESRADLMVKRAKMIADGLSEDMMRPLEAALKEAEIFSTRAKGILDLSNAGRTDRAGRDGMGGTPGDAQGGGRLGGVG